MAGRRSGLCRLLRKKNEGPGPAPARQPEEMQNFQPLQQDPGQHRTEEHVRARGRFRRAVQRFLKFIGIRRRTPRTTPPEGTAQPDTRTNNPKAKPDVDSTPTDPTATSDTALTHDLTSPVTALTHLMATADIAPIHCAANSDTALVDETTTSGTAPTDLMAKADIAPMPMDGTSNLDTAPMDGTGISGTVMTDDVKTSETTPTDVMEKSNTKTTESIGNADTTPTQSVTDAPNLDFFKEKGFSNQKQVPAIVRYIHQCLTFHVSPDVSLHTNILSLVGAHPRDVVMSLLHCAPACDRAASMIWRTIASSGTTAEKVLPTLLQVMEDWPLYSVSSSDGDNKDVFALAATLALQMIIQEPESQEALIIYAPQLLVALLFQVFMSTEQMPEEVKTFWRQCQEQCDLPNDPNRFAVQIIKALLCCLHWEDAMVAMERKCGWDTLLHPDTHHYAVGLLAREMRSVLIPFYSLIATYLLRLLNREEPHWELPALAFLVELLDYVEGRKCHESVLPILSKHLQSQCPDSHRLALRGLLVLSVDPSMAESICSLAEHLVELLHDGDGDVVAMTLSVFLNMLQDKDIEALSSTALKLAEALQPLFDNDNIHVQLLSIRLFQEVMELLAEEGPKTLNTQVHQSLIPLFFHLHDENQCVAEASRETLLSAASFLKRRDLEQLLRREQPIKFCDCLMDKDVSRRDEHLHQALPYLQSPQQPLREAAVRFMGVAAWHMQDLQPVMKALEVMTEDDCSSYSTMQTAVLSAFRRAVSK
ncbi:maestro heat-like repeat family member 5 isoform X3 [Chiroxiphia lanceolata]|uniref:maestro heat-like repeat family member 5 isoform X3 n=1 Tax=Chiroxiphia lanceolata TaxID=296741 RepID=UPI0013CEBA6B|nr:maestro heat-like repeat family member 5 isoform X3 [Chiroxiphia lanceolata]